MKIISFCLFFICVSTSLAQQLTVKDAFLEKWENSKNYLVALAEVMPEEHFDFKPTERQRSFKEQLLHIRTNINWLSISYFSENEYKRSEVDSTVTKTEVLVLLKNAFDASYKIIESTSEEKLKETVDFFAGEKSKLQILNLMQDHVTHHRGQLIVYLNLKSIEPPKYVGW